MKTRKYIYLVLGILFIAFDALITYVMAVDIHKAYHTVNFDLDFWLDTQWPLIPGLLFLFGAYRVQKKINRKNREALLTAIN